jgi:hypothetical protein
MVQAIVWFAIGAILALAIALALWGNARRRP